MYDQSNVERTLYGFWLSPYMSQVAHFLSETGLTYRYERVSPYQGSTLTPEHIERNPLGKRFTKRQQMQWSPNGAHLLLQMRTRVLNGELEQTFREWYPAFRSAGAENLKKAA